PQPSNPGLLHHFGVRPRKRRSQRVGARAGREGADLGNRPRTRWRAGIGVAAPRRQRRRRALGEALPEGACGSAEFPIGVRGTNLLGTTGSPFSAGVGYPHPAVLGQRRGVLPLSQRPRTVEARRSIRPARQLGPIPSSLGPRWKLRLGVLGARGCVLRALAVHLAAPRGSPTSQGRLAARARTAAGRL